MYIFRIYGYHITSLCIWFPGNILVHNLSEIATERENGHDEVFSGRRSILGIGLPAGLKLWHLCVPSLIPRMGGDQSRSWSSQLPYCSAYFASSFPERATLATRDGLMCYWSTLISSNYQEMMKTKPDASFGKLSMVDASKELGDKRWLGVWARSGHMLLGWIFRPTSLSPPRFHPHPFPLSPRLLHVTWGSEIYCCYFEK